MATATTTASRRDVKEYTYLWEGTDRNSRQLRGEVKAASETVVITNLRRQGVRVTKIKRQTFRGGRSLGTGQRAGPGLRAPDRTLQRAAGTRCCFFARA